MKAIVNAVADSLLVERPALGTIQRHSPIWRDPEAGPMVYVFGVNRSVASYRTSEHREDVFEIVVEIVERANQPDLDRDEAAELAFLDKADSLVTWADSHQTLPNVAHRLDFIGLSYPDDVSREHFVRYARMTLLAYKNAVYV